MAKRTTSAPDLTATVDLQPRVATTLDRRTRLEQPESEVLSSSLSRSQLDTSSPQQSRVEVPVESNAQTTSESTEIEASATRIARQETTSQSRAETATPSNARTIELQPSAQAIARATSTEPSVANTLAREISSPRRARQTAQKMTSVRSDVAGSVEASFDSQRPSTRLGTVSTRTFSVVCWRRRRWRCREPGTRSRCTRFTDLNLVGVSKS